MVVVSFSKQPALLTGVCVRRSHIFALPRAKIDESGQLSS
jgi:hypothetical protein